MTILDFNNARRLDQIEAEKRTVDADSIRSRLHADARGFVEWLFSGRALIKGGEARIGDVHGTPGASLSIALQGRDAGLWRDHATGEGGDLIGLYMAYMGYEKGRNFVLALKEIASEFFHDPVQVERVAWQPTAAKRIEEKRHKLGDKPRQDHVELGPPVQTWKYYDLAGNIIASVVRYEPDGTPASKTYRPYCYKKIEGREKWMMGAPDLRPLYRLPQIALAPVVVLVEGEKCAEALASVGIEATTAMQGAEAPVDRTDLTPLAGKTVIIWPDNDKPGLEYAKRIGTRLLAMGCTVRGIEIPAGKPAKWDAADCVEEGSDPRVLIDAATPWEREQRHRFRILDIEEIENLPTPSWLVDGVLTCSGLSVLWGRSGAMKSFVGVDIGLCVGSGAPWHGKAVKAGLVVYIAAEGAYGLAKRAIGWWRTRGANLPKPKFKLIPHSLSLTSEDLDSILEAIAALEERPVLIIIDTLARTFGTGDENKQADMNAYVSAADRLRETTGANVMIIHHSGVHEDKRERGSNVLRGAADTVIKVNRNGDKLQVINTPPEGKQKDAEEFKTVKLRSQKVAYTHAGSEHTTLVLMLDEDAADASEDATGGSTEKKQAKLGKVEKAILEALAKTQTPLGMNRITGSVSAHYGTLTNALETLEAKGLVRKFKPDGHSYFVWELA